MPADEPKATYCERIRLYPPSNHTARMCRWSFRKYVFNFYEQATVPIHTVKISVITILLGVTLASQRAIGRGYAAVLMFIPAFIGAVLVNTLPSQHKIGLLISYWISSELVSTMMINLLLMLPTVSVFTPFVILLGWVGSIVAGHTKRMSTLVFHLRPPF